MSPLPPLPGPQIRTRYLPTGWLDPAGAEHPPGALSEAAVVALAGLARPGSFLRTLRQLGVNIQDVALFPDHHRFSAGELRDVVARASKRGARVVTTEKDAMRLPREFEAWKVRLGVEVLEGEDVLRRALGLI